MSIRNTSGKSKNAFENVKMYRKIESFLVYAPYDQRSETGPKPKKKSSHEETRFSLGRDTIDNRKRQLYSHIPIEKEYVGLRDYCRPLRYLRVR
jgi:hypothetical protein